MNYSYAHHHGQQIVGNHMRGQLHYRFGPTGPTYRYHCAPLSLTRGIPTGGGSTLYLMRSTGGGLISGEELDYDLHCQPGSQVIIGEQTATLIHRMDPGAAGARSHTLLRVDSGAQCEFMPETIIPGGDSVFSSQLEVHVAADSYLVLGDRVTAGRVAHDEWHDYAHLRLSTLIYRDGIPVYKDLLDAEKDPQNRIKPPLTTALGTAQYPSWATLIVIHPEAESLLPQWREYHHPGVHSGVSTIEGGIWARLIGLSADHLLRAQYGLWDLARRSLIAQPLPPYYARRAAQ